MSQATKRRKFFDRNVVTAAKRKARRRARGKRSGRRTWLYAWPDLRTDKGGKNAGRAPTYHPGLRPGDPGQVAGTAGAWPFKDDVKPRVVR